ncbi:unnamed protein product [Arctogadus glacialis]
MGGDLEQVSACPSGDSTSVRLSLDSQEQVPAPALKAGYVSPPWGRLSVAPPVGHLHAGLRCCRLAEEEQSEQLFPLWLHRRFGCHWRAVSVLPPSCPQPSSGSDPLCTKTIHLLMSVLYH